MRSGPNGCPTSNTCGSIDRLAVSRKPLVSWFCDRGVSHFFVGSLWFLKTRWNGQSELARFPEWLNQDLTSRSAVARTMGPDRGTLLGPVSASVAPRSLPVIRAAALGIFCSVSVTRRPLAQPLRSVTLLSIYACSATCWRSPQSRGLGINICFVGLW